jgi:hypothetical protein
MQDQVASLQARGLAADYLASTRSESERAALLARLDALGPGAAAAARGGAAPLALLYVTPELLQTEAFRARLQALHARGGGGDGVGRPAAIKLVAIDEAHCISQYVSPQQPPGTRGGWDEVPEAGRQAARLQCHESSQLMEARPPARPVPNTLASPGGPS